MTNYTCNYISGTSLEVVNLKETTKSSPLPPDAFLQSTTSKTFKIISSILCGSEVSTADIPVTTPCHSILPSTKLVTLTHKAAALHIMPTISFLVGTLLANVTNCYNTLLKMSFTVPEGLKKCS